jgi:DNA invertase Pin-like site-specific DNA recombinase
MADKFISLLRVSTTRQGESGLGLEAQRQQVQSHVQRVQGNLITEFVEVESGRKLQRPML